MSRNSDVSCSAAKQMQAIVAPSDIEKRDTVMNKNLNKTYLQYSRLRTAELAYSGSVACFHFTPGLRDKLVTIAHSGCITNYCHVQRDTALLASLRDSLRYCPVGDGRYAPLNVMPPTLGQECSLSTQFLKELSC